MEGQFSSRKKYTLLFEYFVVFVIIIYAGKASKFVTAIEGWNNSVGLMLPIICIIILGFLKGVQLTHKYWLFLIGYTLYFIASTVKFGELHPRFFMNNIIYFSIAYVVVSGLRFRFFRIYEDILYYLCIIGVCFWILQNLIPSTFIEFLRNFEFSKQGENGNVDFNIIIYTVNNFVVAPDHILNIGGIQIYRNAGFAWEPGAFSTYINIGILINFIRNKFTLKDNKHFWVFLIALATTFSTTGYSLFLLLILFNIYNQDMVKVVWLIPVIVVISMFLFTLPFMSEKLTRKADFNPQEMIYYSAKYNIHYAPQRFQSLKIDFIDFINHPIIGYGGHREARWTNQLGAQIYTVSGIGKVLAQYGTVGLLFFLISLWQSSKQIITLYNIKGTIFPVMFILMISLSYSIFTPLFMCIWVMSYSSFLKTEVMRQYTIRNFLKKLNTSESL